MPVQLPYATEGGSPMKFTTAPRDLTTGSPARSLLLYAIPMLASMFFQQAYSLADSWIAGNRI